MMTGLFCSIPSARLVRETSPREGLVEVYYNKTWGWVCGDQWGRQDADVACRMKGSMDHYQQFWKTKRAQKQNPLFGFTKCTAVGTKCLSLDEFIAGWNLMTAEEELVPYADRKVKISTPACTNPKRFHNGDNIHKR